MSPGTRAFPGMRAGMLCPEVTMPIMGEAEAGETESSGSDLCGEKRSLA